MSTAAFEQLDPDLPLTLLPVRLEARYLPRGRPRHLLIRVYPDVVHADGHQPTLTERELLLGQQFWHSIWNQTDATVISEARTWLASQTTNPYRALWVSTATTPTNLDSGDDEPTFADLTTSEEATPVTARLLPDQWMVRLYDKDGQLAHTQFSQPVADDLAMAPSLANQPPDAVHPITGKPLSAPEAFLANQDLLWTVDFDVAERRGMGIRIPIGQVPKPVSRLLVLGVRPDRDPIGEGDALDDVMAAHWYTRGVDLVPQGTPTNNTERARSGVSLSDPDIDELFDREVSDRPVAQAGRGVLIAANPALLYRLAAADSVSLGLGRVRANVFDRAVHADWGEGAAAWAMNLSLGYAVVGRYLSSPFGKADGSRATGDLTATFRQWYVDWVRGAGPLPVLRVGEQPYGLLPITDRPEQNNAAFSFDQKLEHQLATMVDFWQASLPVPVLDPEAADGVATDSPEAVAGTVGEVLGAVPHPTALRLRTATNHLPDDEARFDELIDRMEAHIENDQHNAQNLAEGGPVDSLIWRYWWENDRKRYVTGRPDENPPIPPPDSGTQTANLGYFRDEVQHAYDLLDEIGAHNPGHYPTLALSILQLIDDDLTPLLDMHRESANAVPQQLWDWVDGAGLGSDEVVRLMSSTYADNTTDAAPLVVSRGATVTEIRDLLTAAIAELDRAETNNVPPPSRLSLIDEAAPAPLLAHLVNINVGTVPTTEIGPVRLALQVLVAMIDHESVTDPIKQLERLLRESLGLAMYRWDAWATGRAAELLAKKRRVKYGSQIGAYGWLLDLQRSDDPVSQGFIHASSLTHASTAAVLRSGWSAYGTQSGETPLSVDLSSQRVRGGQWILDGVRNGQDLAELLGARFERYLHDLRRDVWIETVRRAALEVTGSSDPPTAIVDGLLVAGAYSEVDHTDREEEFFTKIEAELTSTADGEEADEVRQALAAIAGDLDSVADLSMAQSVHSILQGNSDAAAAMLAVTGGGDGAVPPITVVDSQREAQLITHRVLAAWSTETDPPTRTLVASLAGRAEPRLAAWLEGLLPDPAAVVAEATIRDAGGAVVGSDVVVLAALGLPVDDAARLAGTAAGQSRSRLGRLLAAFAALEAQAQYGPDVTVELDTTAPARSDDQLSLDEFGLLAAAGQHAIGRSRPLTAADLEVPGVILEEPKILLDELDQRVAATEQALAELLNHLTGGDTAIRFQALAQAAVIGAAAAVAAAEAGSGRDDADSVAGALKNRLYPVDGQDQVDRLRQLTGNATPILPVFKPSANSERASSASSARRRNQVSADGHRWLRQSGRVRPDLGAATDWLLLAETALDRPPATLGLAQLPEDNDGWAAVTNPRGRGDRLCLVSLTGPKSLADQEAMTGVLFDSWTEGIPRPNQQTGVAVHFDGPTARAPQAILLSVVDEEESGFNADGLADQLLHTIDMFKYRSVGPDHVADIGHYLPAVFLPSNVTIGDLP